MDLTHPIGGHDTLTRGDQSDLLVGGLDKQVRCVGSHAFVSSVCLYCVSGQRATTYNVLLHRDDSVLPHMCASSMRIHSLVDLPGIHFA